MFIEVANVLFVAGAKVTDKGYLYPGPIEDK
jgi:hypothetical protein